MGEDFFNNLAFADNPLWGGCWIGDLLWSRPQEEMKIERGCLNNVRVINTRNNKEAVEASVQAA